MKSSYLHMFLMAGLFAVSCKDSGVETDYSNIVDTYTRWQTYKLKNYSLEQSLSCYCVNGGVPMKIVVSENRVAEVLKLSDGIPLPLDQWSWYKSVDELFEIANSVNRDSVAYFHIEYDVKYGYPTILYVDPSENTADEEYGYRSQNLSTN